MSTIYFKILHTFQHLTNTQEQQNPKELPGLREELLKTQVELKNLIQERDQVQKQLTSCKRNVQSWQNEQIRLQSEVQRIRDQYDAIPGHRRIQELERKVSFLEALSEYRRQCPNCGYINDGQIIA